MQKLRIYLIWRIAHSRALKVILHEYVIGSVDQKARWGGFEIVEARRVAQQHATPTGAQKSIRRPKSA